MGDMFTGIVYKHTGSHYIIKNETSGILFACTAGGKMRLHDTVTTNPIAVGDKVEVEEISYNNGVIKKIHTRKNYIIRRSTNLSKQAHIIAANIDQAFLIVTMVLPNVRLEFVDRFLVTCEAYKVPVKILINKVDCYNNDTMDRMKHFTAIYNSANYCVLDVSAKTGLNIDILREDIKNSLCLFSGVSGVGKSSLINAIDTVLNLRTGNISDYHKKGMHTTTFYEIFDIATGGHIIDSPGIKGFGLIDVEKTELYHFFPELFLHATKCKFNMCTHKHEPNCAVKKAVASGEIFLERYESYLKMLDDESSKYR